MRARIPSALGPDRTESRFCGESWSREFFLSVWEVEWAPSREGAPYRRNCGVFLAGQNAGDVLDRSADVVRQERDGTDHGQRDHGKDHAVLRHRLTLLALAQRVGGDLHEGEELQHLCHLPSLVIDAHAVARGFREE